MWKVQMTLSLNMIVAVFKRHVAALMVVTIIELYIQNENAKNNMYTDDVEY